MKTKSTYLPRLAISLLVIVVGLAAVLTGSAPRFTGGGAAMVSVTSLLYAILVVGMLSFIYGSLRYSLASGISLAFASLHDQLLSLSLTALLSTVLPQPYLLPLGVVMVCVFSYANTLVLLRLSNEQRKASSMRELSNTQAAEAAAAQHRSLMLVFSGLVVFFMAAALVGGGIGLIAWLLPLLTGLAASMWSAGFITPGLWAMCLNRSGKVKTAR